LAYFAIATFVLISCLGSFVVLMRLPITKYYLHKTPYTSGLSTVNDSYVALSDPLLPISDKSDVDAGKDSLLVSQTRKSEIQETDGSIFSIFQLIRIPAISVFLTFTVTIGVFPAIVVLIESDSQCVSSERFFNDLFLPFMFLVYNIFDLIGRILAEKLKPLLHKNNILQFSLCRAAFIPLILFCNVSGSKLPVLLKNDAFPILIVALFALTNGYTASCAMILGPSLVNGKDAGIAGTIMIFALTLGLLGGGSISFLILYISQGSVM
jgi:equilibrative nucleoside transporter 1/2/3